MLLAQCVELGRLYQLLLACKQFIGEVAVISWLCRDGSDLKIAFDYCGNITSDKRCTIFSLVNNSI